MDMEKVVNCSQCGGQTKVGLKMRKDQARLCTSCRMKFATNQMILERQGENRFVLRELTIPR